MPFSQQEIEVIFRLAEKLTGSCQTGELRKDNLLQNVAHLMAEVGLSDLQSLLAKAQKETKLHHRLISALTIHTTAWFREAPHVVPLVKEVKRFLNTTSGEIRVTSLACSTGEEVYTAALALAKELTAEEYARVRFFGSDIDPVSVAVAKAAIYPEAGIAQIPKIYAPFLRVGQGRAAGYFTVAKEIRDKCEFAVGNLTDENQSVPGGQAHVVFVRNVLIYFSQGDQKKILEKVGQILVPGGLLLLGHSDRFVHITGLSVATHPVYFKDDPKVGGLRTSRKGRASVLIVEDSPTVRKVMAKILDSSFEVFECESSEAADEFLARHRKDAVDAISLDLNLPGENGVAWLQKQRKKGNRIPTVIVSDSTPQDAEKVFGALEGGAQEYVLKSRLAENPDSVRNIFESLVYVEQARQGFYPTASFTNLKLDPEVLLIGASTGGPEALSKLLDRAPTFGPPVVVVQHMNPEFNRAFAQRLSRQSGLQLGDVQNEALKRGHLYMAGGDYHIELYRRGPELMIRPSAAAVTGGHRPAVENLFRSAVQAKVQGLVMMLTGMGADGANIFPELFSLGCYTMAQDQESSIVFGMPKRAIDTGAVCLVNDIEGLRDKWHEWVNQGTKRKVG